MSSYYCANYYGLINCHNTVRKFGDRCALCISTNAGTSSSTAMQNGETQASEQWVENAKREQPRRTEEQGRRERLRRTVDSTPTWKSGFRSNKLAY